MPVKFVYEGHRVKVKATGTKMFQSHHHHRLVQKLQGRVTKSKNKTAKYVVSSNMEEQLVKVLLGQCKTVVSITPVL